MRRVGGSEEACGAGHGSQAKQDCRTGVNGLWLAVLVNPPSLPDQQLVPALQPLPLRRLPLSDVGAISPVCCSCHRRPGEQR